MSLETAALMNLVLTTGHAVNCDLNPDASPPGPRIRALHDAPFLAQSAATGIFENTAPQAYIKTTDAPQITPEVTILLIDGQRYIAARKEKIEGDRNWTLLILREVNA